MSQPITRGLQGQAKGKALLPNRDFMFIKNDHSFVESMYLHEFQHSRYNITRMSSVAEGRILFSLYCKVVFLNINSSQSPSL